MAARILVVTAVVMMVAGGVGFIAAEMLNSFVLDRYNAYGEVPIPGTGKLHLPAGEVEVSLHVRVISSPRGNGLPLPHLGLTIVPPPGVADPKVTESFGGTTTVNNDTHRRVWLMQVPAEGDYQIETDGQVGGYIDPQLAFGKSATRHSLVWVSVAVFGVGLLDLICATWWLRRLRRRSSGIATVNLAPILAPPARGGENARIEQLRKIAALRDSGALTESEFLAEKRRILKGH